MRKMKHTQFNWTHKWRGCISKHRSYQIQEKMKSNLYVCAHDYLDDIFSCDQVKICCENTHKRATKYKLIYVFKDQIAIATRIHWQWLWSQDEQDEEFSSLLWINRHFKHE
jgi:hypothetical protein